MKTNMADNSGPTQAISPNSDGGNDDKEKEKKMSDVMQLLYARSNRQRSWNDTIKALRANPEKRQQTEAFEKVMLQKYLDTLQKACRVNSLTLMLDRLEMLARHVGMQCTQEKDSLVYLNHDLIHIEIQLEFNGVAKDVKVKHIQDFQLQSCPDMVTALNDGDFEEFQRHCEGLISITQIGNDKKTRSKCFMALHALESDLNTLVQYQSSITGTSNYIHKSPLGIVQPRLGGHPLKMTYFVHPYDLLDEKSERSLQMSVSTVKERKLGCSVSLSLEASSPHRLQNIPLISFVKTHDGKSLPSFAQTTNQTSSQVPAVFILKLNKPTPLSLSIIRKIKNTTGVDVPMSSKTLPLLHHLVKLNCKSKKYDYSKGLYVTVPDQNHCYFMNCVSNSDDLQGAMVSKIPFAHPANVAKILIYLRQQMLFNTVMSSCIRSNPKQDLGNSMTFEVMPVSLQHIVVTFEHPANDSIATAEIFLNEVNNVQCQIRSTGAITTICPDEYASKVLLRCLSLPLTMRAILKKATTDLGLVMVQSPLPTVPITPRTLSKLGQDHRLAFVDPHKRYGSQLSVNSQHSDHGKEMMGGIPSGFLEPGMGPVDDLEAFNADKIQRNPMLARLLDANDKNASGGGGGDPQPPSMLSALLGDQPPPATTKQKRVRKRRSNDQRSPGSSAKSPKRRVLDDDMGSGSNLSSVEVSPSQSTMGFEPSPSHSSGVSTPVTVHTSLAGLIADDPFLQVSPMIKLATTVDSIMKQESKSVTSEGFGASDSSAQSVRVKEESSKQDDGPRKKLSSGSSLAELLESSPKCESLPNNMFFSKDRSNSTSDLSSSSSTVHSKSLNDSRQDKGSPYEFKPDPVLNDSSYSSKTKSEQLSSNIYNHERSSSSSKSSSEKFNSALWDSKSDSILSKSEEKVKDKSKKEKKESSDDKPHEREKITVKLNTKELTAKTSVKERSSSPHDIELTKSHSRDGKSSRESSKSNREKSYDISSDNALPSSLVITRPLLTDGARSGSPSLKFKKIRTEDGKGEKRKKSSKHDGESSKRKREDGKKDKSSKKRKVYNDSDLSDRTGSDRYSAVEKGPTTIKITTKMQLQSSKLSSPIKASKSLSSSNPSGLKSIKADRLSMSPQGSKSKSSIKALNRSKSESQALSLGRNYDSKLNKTPTIKLKPVVMPNSATSINISSKGSSSPGSAPSKSSSDLKSKLSAGPKSRKPLDAIVDKLKTKQGTTPGSVLQFKPRDGGEKKDALTKRNEVDEVRKAIIQQGIKPSGTTKELTSYRAGPSMRPTKLSLDGNKRSDMKGSGTPTTPIPKISQNPSKSSPASSSSKLGTIPKTSNSSSNGNNSDYPSSKSNSVNSNYGSASSSSSGGNSTDYSSSRDPGTLRVSGQSSSEGPRIMKLSNSNNSHGPSDSTSRTENSDSKRETKDVTSASSASFSSASVSLSHGNSTSTTSTSTASGSSTAANSYSAGPSNSLSAAATSASSFPSSSSALSSSASSLTSAPLPSSSSSSLSATNSSVSNSGSGKDLSKDSDKTRKRSVDDISERLLSRHFLDAVTKREDGGEEEKKGSSKSASDNRTDFTELPDKVRPNGYNKSDRLNDSWSGKEDGREGRSAEGSADYSSGSRSNCVDSPARSDRRSHTNLEDKENSVGHEEDSVFREPTPKGSKSGVEVTEDRLEPRARSDSRTKPVLSPRSDVSSPEDGLVIDCPGTPKSVPSINRSEKTVSKPTTPINCSDVTPHGKNTSSSAVVRTPRSPSPHKTKASPCLSPATKSPGMMVHSPGPSPGANAQVDDDELMDVALIL